MTLAGKSTCTLPYMCTCTLPYMSTCTLPGSCDIQYNVMKILTKIL